MNVTRVGPNLKGRDFVCGDIHGSYSCVERFLEGVNFTTDDRLFCAGDLVDRGPDNEKCLDLLYEPWFFATKGNHEQLMEDFFDNAPLGPWWPRNGGAWGVQYAGDPSDLAAHIRLTVKEKVSKLPHVINVETRDGMFHVLHAELHLQGRALLTDEIMMDWDKLAEYATAQTADGDCITWGRYHFMSFYKKTMDSTAIAKSQRRIELEKTAALFTGRLSQIYSGHTVVKQPIQLFKLTNLDTCAYASYDGDQAPEWAGLSVCEPATGKFWLANDRVFKEVQPLVFE